MLNLDTVFAFKIFQKQPSKQEEICWFAKGGEAEGDAAAVVDAAGWVAAVAWAARGEK